MKLLGYSILLAAAFAAASARCPNLCSGHGDCNNDDMCQCWPGYQGFDCSERTCPMVEAWALDDSDNPHDFAECGNRGICDRSTGSCQCFDGYTGRGCERSVCPNACSGRGKCNIMADLPNYSPSGSALNWDEKALTACVCDPGFMGPDCSQRICPHGDDPMTACDINDMNQVQTFEFWIPGHAAEQSTYADLSNVWVSQDYAGISYTSVFNETFSVGLENIFTSSGATHVQASTLHGKSLDDVASNIETALRSVPRQRLQDVTVSGGTVNSTTDGYDVRSQFQVTFAKTGDQNPLTCSSKISVTMPNDKKFETFGCPFEGCQPRILQPRLFTQAFGCVGNTNTSVDFAQIAPTGSLSDLKVQFTEDSLLVCPTGKICDSADNYQGGIDMLIYQTEQDGDYYIYAQGLGSQTFQAGLTNDYYENGTITGDVQADVVPFKSIDDTTSPDATRFFGGTQIHDVTGATTRQESNFDYKFLGIFKSLASEIDVSRIIPGTKVKVSATSTDFNDCNGAGANFPAGVFVRTHYSVAQCGGIGVATAPSAEAENIECSRRGQCNRGSGLCECFDGYYGSACEKQTILV